MIENTEEIVFMTSEGLRATEHNKKIQAQYAFHPLYFGSVKQLLLGELSAKQFEFILNYLIMLEGLSISNNNPH